MFRGISLEGVWDISWTGERTADDSEFGMNPSVQYYRRLGMLNLPLHRAVELGLGWNYTLFGGETRLFNGGVSYGKITRIHADFEGPIFRLKFTQIGDEGLTLECENVDIKGDIRGHIEFWPFTPTLVDLLGYRRYFYGSGTASGYRYYAGTSFNIFKSLKFTPEVNFVDLFTDARFSSWQPVWLVFGKTDVRDSALEISRLQAILLAFNFRLPRRWMEFQYSFQQWVPVKIRKIPAISKPTTPAVPKGGKKRSTGGSMHKFTISLNLDEIIPR